MLLAADIGNTNITFGIFQDKRLVRRFNIPARSYGLKKLKGLLGKNDVDDSIICSVVPQLTRVLKKDLKKILPERPLIIGKDIKVPLVNRYRNPAQVGQDRLVNAYAGIMLYGAPLVVVDFGTAVTFDVVSKDKEYLGGFILPGLEISLDALAQRTALLPSIKLGKPKEFIGGDTKSSMLSGIVYGFAALTDDLVIRIKKKIGKNTKVIGTGGNINLIGTYCRKFDKIDRNLTLKGSNFLFRDGSRANREVSP